MLFVGYIWVINSYAQSTNNVTVTATVLEVYSNAEDGSHMRHRWLFQTALDDLPYEDVHTREKDSEQYNRWWPWNYNILEKTTEQKMPGKIRIKFWGFEDENGKGRRHERDGEIEIPINFEEGEDYIDTIKIGADHMYQARIRFRYTIPQPPHGITVSSSSNGSPESNFCEGSTIYLNTQDYNPGTDLLPKEFKYVWEYHFLGDHTTKNVCRVSNLPGSPKCQSVLNPNITYLECGNTLYDPKCEQCLCTSEKDQEYWYELGQDPNSSILWTATQRNGYKKVAFRYRLKHKNYGTAGPPSDTTGYVTIYDPPPTLNYIDNPEPNFNTAADSVYNNGDLRATHVSCRDKDNGKITIKNVTGSPGREYFYTLKGPVPKDSPAPTEADGGAPWNINGQGKPAPQSNQPATWLTFPQDDPTGLQQLKAGTYWLIIENWDRRDPTTDNKLENLDLRACYVARKITVKQPAAALTAKDSPKAYIGGVHVSCYESSDGEVTIDAGGGIAPYRYFLRKQGDAAFIEQPTPTFTGLASHRAGTPINYDYYVKDAMGCPTKVKQFSLTAPAPLQVKTAAPTHEYPSGGPYNIRCHGGTDQATLAAQGGTAPYTIRINGTDYSTDQDGNPIVVEGLSGDTDYAIRMTDANGCQVDTTLRLQQPDSLLLTQHEAVPPTCAGGRQRTYLSRSQTGHSVHRRQIHLHHSPYQRTPGISGNLLRRTNPHRHHRQLCQPD